MDGSFIMDVSYFFDKLTGEINGDGKDIAFYWDCEVGDGWIEVLTEYLGYQNMQTMRMNVRCL